MVATRREFLKSAAAVALCAKATSSPLQAQVPAFNLRWRGPTNAIIRPKAGPAQCTLWQQAADQTPEAQAMAWVAQAEQIAASRLGDNPLGQAICAVDQAKVIADAHDIPRVDAAIANTLGNIAQLRPGADAAATARAYFGEAAQIATNAGDASLAARALINGARIDLRQGSKANAAELIELASRALGSSGGAFEQVALASTYVDLAALDQSYLKPAFVAVEAARLVVGDEGDQRLRSWGEGLAGELYRTAGRDDDALLLLRRAANLAELANAPEIAYRWQWQAGQILSEFGELDAAIAAFEVARNNVDKVRLDLPEFDPQTGTSLFRRTLGPIYTGLADLYLRQAKRDGESASPRPLINARKVVEQLKAAELDDYFGDACTAALLEQSVDLEQSRTPGAAVLYPILLPDRTELVVSLPDGSIRSESSGMGAEEIGLLADQLRNSLTPPNLVDGIVNERDFVEPARQLYDQLIAPIMPYLEGVGTIVFVPDGPLRNIPIAALLNGDRYLVEDFAIGTTLGLQLLQSAQIDRSESRLLFAGIAEQIPNQDEFPPLVSVVLERDRISEVVEPRQLLFDDGFSEGAITSQITDRTFDIVHVATHGLFGAKPEDSFILAWDDELNMTEFENILVQTRFRDDPIDLLTLSACKTAEGNDRAALGIAGLAVKVGARSALASLWEAVDASTAPMMADFYSKLIRDKKTKAISLQEAQQMLINSNNSEFAFGREVTGKTHPVFWSSFIVVGSWV